MLSDSEDEGDEVFDLRTYIDMVCEREGRSSDSELSGTNSCSSEALTRRAVRKVIKQLRKTSPYVASDSELSSDGCMDSIESDDESDWDSSPSDDDLSLTNFSSDTNESKAEIKENKEEVLVEEPEDVPRDNVYKIHPNNDNKTESNIDQIDNDLKEDEEEKEEDLPGMIKNPNCSGENDEEVNTVELVVATELRWPLSNYYTKELDVVTQFTPDPEGPLPSYKSKKSSASVPGRKRNILLGRVWWVEWWSLEEKNSEGSHSHTIDL